ncbi:MAG: hypothetical protein ACREOO_06985 [bacterium]
MLKASWYVQHPRPKSMLCPNQPRSLLDDISGFSDRFLMKNTEPAGVNLPWLGTKEHYGYHLPNGALVVVRKYKGE